MQYHLISFNVIEYHTIPFNTMRYYREPSNNIQYYAIPSNTISIQCSSHGATSISDGVCQFPKLGKWWRICFGSSDKKLVFVATTLYGNLSHCCCSPYFNCAKATKYLHLFVQCKMLGMYGRQKLAILKPF